MCSPTRINAGATTRNASRSRAPRGGDETDASEVVADGAPARRRRFLEPPARTEGGNGSNGTSGNAKRDARNARARQARQPTLTYPKGLSPAPQRKRLMAMVIDLGVMVLVFLAATLTATAVVKNQHPETVKRESAITKQIDKERPISKTLDKKADELEAKSEKLALDKSATSSEQDAAKSAATKARAASDDAKQHIKDLEKEFSDLEGTLIGTRALVTGVFYFLGILILAIPSARNGQTLGKRIQGIKVVRENGSPIGWIGAFRRYGLLDRRDLPARFAVTTRSARGRARAARGDAVDEQPEFPGCARPDCSYHRRRRQSPGRGHRPDGIERVNARGGN